MSGSLFEGSRLHTYREKTNDASMVGVAFTPALDKCVRCLKRRTTITGSYSKSGKFVCGMCRPVFARIADKTTPASQGCTPRLASKTQV